MLFNDTLKTQRISLIKAILEVRTSICLTTLQFSITTLQLLLKLYHEKWLVIVEYKYYMIIKLNIAKG